MVIDCSPNWGAIPGDNLVDVGVGADGSVWVVNTNDDIFKLNSNGSWNVIGGKLVKIDVGPDGNAWGVNSAGNIYRYTGSSW